MDYVEAACAMETRLEASWRLVLHYFAISEVC